MNNRKNEVTNITNINVKQSAKTNLQKMLKKPQIKRMDSAEQYMSLGLKNKASTLKSKSTSLVSQRSNVSSQASSKIKSDQRRRSNVSNSQVF